MADNILCGLDGEPIGFDFLTAAVANIEGSSAAVTAVDVVAGTENKLPTSHSAVLSLRRGAGDALPFKLFVKKVSAEGMKHKPWTDRRRTLAYSRTELNFYTEFAEALCACGIRLPRFASAVDQLAPLLDDCTTDSPGEEPQADLLQAGGCILFLECLPETLTQCSSISFSQAQEALTAAAALHAAAWGDESLLTRAAARLQQYGGACSLSIRNPNELNRVRSNWERFVNFFSVFDPVLFAKPNILALVSPKH
jgi:hypothetical protein